MLPTPAVAAPVANTRPVPVPALTRPGQPDLPAPARPQWQSDAQRIADSLQLIAANLPVQRRIVHAGEPLYQAGEHFTTLHVVHSGLFKVVNLAADGREQVVALHFKGDWLGFDGIAGGAHACDAVALDIGEVWSVRYDALLLACGRVPALLAALHSAMSQEMSRDRAWLMSVCTLSADARVADFLRHWVEALASRGLRTDQITLRMSRAEIGNCLGMTLESVSRALSRLARQQIIAFGGRGRREVHIPDAQALVRFVQDSLTPMRGATLQ